MRATKKPIEHLQSIYDVLGTYGGGFIANNPEYFHPITFEMGSIKEDSAKAMIGVYQTEKNGDRDFDIQFFLELKFRDGKIKEVEIKRCITTHVIWKMEIDEDGFRFMDGRPTGELEDSNRIFSRFMKNIVKVICYVQRDYATVTKYEEALDGNVVPSIK